MRARPIGSGTDLLPTRTDCDLSFTSTRWEWLSDALERLAPWLLSTSAGRLDVLTLMAVSSVSLASCCALALAIAGCACKTSYSSTDKTDSLAASGLVLLVAVGLLNTAGAFFRLAIDWIVYYIIRERPQELGAADRTLMGFDDRNLNFDFRPDLFPFFGMAWMLALVVSVLWIAAKSGCAGIFRPWWIRTKKTTRRRARALWVHNVVACLGREAGGLTLYFVLIGSVLTLLLLDYRAFFTVGVAWTMSLALLHGCAALVVLFLVSGSPAVLKKTLSSIADIAGFWSVRFHPWAGASYRPAAMKGIAEACRELRGCRNIALVGHSQGSVLAAWFLKELHDTGNSPASDTERATGGTPTLHLVTCGSPLQSLYATLFPQHFGIDFRREVSKVVKSSWANVWRATDPIATPLTDAPIHNIELEDPPPGSSQLKIHSDYWVARKQMRWIADAVCQAHPRESDSEPR